MHGQPTVVRSHSIVVGELDLALILFLQSVIDLKARRNCSAGAKNITVFSRNIFISHIPLLCNTVVVLNANGTLEA